MEGNWKFLTYSLLIFRFAVPFLLLLSKPAKASKTMLKLAAWIIVIMHFVEISWIIKPVQDHHGFHLAWVDITVLVGLGSIVLGLFVNTFRKNNMIPSNDPHLEECLHKH
jgi:apolipoprotein N-acyltransferase